VATLAFNGSTAVVEFTPISSQLANLPNAASTMAALVRLGDDGDVVGLRNPSAGGANWYHGIGRDSSSRLFDDEGIVGCFSTSTALTTSVAGAGNYRIIACDWGTGTATEQAHWSATISSAESWTHSATNTNGGLRAGPGTTGRLRIGEFGSFTALTGEVALVGIWVGVRMTQAQIEELWTNKRTSDWYSHSAGTPTTLIELTSTSPTDIGANPSTLGSVTAATATGADPTGWTFDGQGSTPPNIEDGFAAPAGMFSPNLIEKGWWH
jgi:hypothetical protein